MKVILKEKVENLGTLGDIISVRSGYARNYLVPYGKAIQATQETIATFSAQKAELEALEQKRISDATEKAEKLQDKTFVVAAQAGDAGKLFGSVGTKEIADILSAETGIEIEKRQVRMPEGVIRSIGDYELNINLYTGITTTVNISVIAE